MKAKTRVLLFIPAAFCAFISRMAAFMGDNAKPAFFAFLPMCFFFAAMPLITINKRLSDLEEKLVCELPPDEACRYGEIGQSTAFRRKRKRASAS